MGIQVGGDVRRRFSARANLDDRHRLDILKDLDDDATALPVGKRPECAPTPAIAGGEFFRLSSKCPTKSAAPKPDPLRRDKDRQSKAEFHVKHDSGAGGDHNVRELS